MNHFGASEGEMPRPWWRSRVRHDKIVADERLRSALQRAVQDKDFVPDTELPDKPVWADMDTEPDWVQIFARIVDDRLDDARRAVRALSASDNALLGFYAAELSRLVSEEDQFRTDTDRRAARRTYENRTAPDTDPDNG